LYVNEYNVPTIQFSLFSIAQYHKLASEGFKICTQEKLPRNIKKSIKRGENGRTLQESNGGGSLSRMDRCNRCHVYR